MAEDYQEEHRRKTAKIRSTMDTIMGILLSLLGLYFISYGWLGHQLMGRDHNDLDYVIGGLFLIYGIWRIYRGYKKDYYK